MWLNIITRDQVGVSAGGRGVASAWEPWLGNTGSPFPPGTASSSQPGGEQRGGCGCQGWFRGCPTRSRCGSPMHPPTHPSPALQRDIPRQRWMEASRSPTEACKESARRAVFALQGARVLAMMGALAPTDLHSALPSSTATGRWGSCCSTWPWGSPSSLAWPTLPRRRKTSALTPSQRAGGGARSAWPPWATATWCPSPWRASWLPRAASWGASWLWRCPSPSSSTSSPTFTASRRRWRRPWGTAGRKTPRMRRACPATTETQRLWASPPWAEAAPTAAVWPPAPTPHPDPTVPWHRGARGTRSLAVSTARLLHRDMAEEPGSPCLAPRLASNPQWRTGGFGGDAQWVPAASRPRDAVAGSAWMCFSPQPATAMLPHGCKQRMWGWTYPCQKGSKKKRNTGDPSSGTAPAVWRGFSSAPRFCVIQGEVK